jgi:hypothetical protein
MKAYCQGIHSLGMSRQSKFRDDCTTDISMRLNGKIYIAYIALVDRRGHQHDREMFEAWPDMLHDISMSIPIVRSTDRRRGIY